jgi:hypothetical protein
MADGAGSRPGTTWQISSALAPRDAVASERTLSAGRAVERHEDPAQAELADPLSLGSLRWDDEQRAVRAPDDHQGRAAESPPGESPLPMARQDDEIDVLRPGEIDDLLRGPTLQQLDGRRGSPWSRSIR